MVRTSGAPLAMTEPIRKVILAVDSDQPISNARTLEKVAADSVATRRLIMIVLGVFAAVSLLLAALGLYGVMAYSVTQHTHEIGIRMALGARQWDVLKLVFQQGIVLTAAGLLIGLAGSLALTRFLASQLFEVQTTDPTALLSVCGLLAGAALIACWIPARHATRVDPIVALRVE